MRIGVNHKRRNNLDGFMYTKQRKTSRGGWGCSRGNHARQPFGPRCSCLRVTANEIIQKTGSDRGLKTNSWVQKKGGGQS